MATYNHDQEDQAPPLIPFKKKAGGQPNSLQTPNQKKNVKNDTLNNIIKDSIQKTPKNTQTKDDEKNVAQFRKQPDKSEETQKKNKAGQKKDNQYNNKMENQRTRQNEKMKSLIAQMLNSMSVKNLTEQLYPVSNQVIQELITNIQQQIAYLNVEIQKKQSTITNQNDFHAKKQLDAIRREHDHCTLIKQFYCEKMNYRNKIQNLQQQIINLKSENRDLKLKVCRGIQNIQNYKHNLPCDRQKQLIQKLSICTQQLAQQKQMRQNLQKNIESIIMNFKKLYQQADAARQIVTSKLKQVEQRQRKLKKLKDQEDYLSEERRLKYNNYDYSGDKKQPSNGFYDPNSQANNQIDARKYNDQDYRKTPNRGKTGQNNKQKQIEKEKQKKAANESMFGSMTLQQKIKKMRSNQNNFKRILNS